jgi:hypothetical protein
LFEEARIVRMAEYFHTLLAELLDHPETKLMKLNAMHKMTRN